MLKEAYEKYLRKINIPIFNCIFILEEFINPMKNSIYFIGTT